MALPYENEEAVEKAKHEGPLYEAFLESVSYYRAIQAPHRDLEQLIATARPQLCFLFMRVLTAQPSVKARHEAAKFIFGKPVKAKANLAYPQHVKADLSHLVQRNLGAQIEDPSVPYNRNVRQVTNVLLHYVIELMRRI